MKTPIQHVSDTALWVAAFRAHETERAKSLFKDPLARKLIGEKGEMIARKMERPGAVEWSVVVRTCIIDQMVANAIAQGVDTILNLGAGLDTRPYRLDLPKDLLWIEVDYPGIIDLKNERLAEETPRCRLERMVVDLADDEKRTRLLSDVAARSKKVLVITEGVLPYLPNDAVKALALNLRSHSCYAHWIVDYWSRLFRDQMRKSKMFRKLRNAPFVFDPPIWHQFFAEVGWTVELMKYLPIEGLKLGRPAPTPLWLKFLGLFLPPAQKQMYAQMFGYAMLKPRD
jgi:methyltransferase (TIGR00027 family)